MIRRALFANLLLANACSSDVAGAPTKSIAAIGAPSQAA